MPAPPSEAAGTLPPFRLRPPRACTIGSPLSRSRRSVAVMAMRPPPPPAVAFGPPLSSAPFAVMRVAWPVTRARAEISTLPPEPAPHGSPEPRSPSARTLPARTMRAMSPALVLVRSATAPPPLPPVLQQPLPEPPEPRSVGAVMEP